MYIVICNCSLVICYIKIVIKPIEAHFSSIASNLVSSKWWKQPSSTPVSTVTKDNTNPSSIFKKRVQATFLCDSKYDIKIYKYAQKIFKSIFRGEGGVLELNRGVL